MSRMLSTPARSAATGIGATALMDLGGEVVRRLTGVEPLDYRLLGRWIGHLPEGQLRHENIRAAEPVPHERELGWAAPPIRRSTFPASSVCFIEPAGLR